MSWSSGRGVLLGLVAVLAAPAAHAVDASRLDLLAGEAVSVLGSAAAAPSRVGLLVLISIPLLTMAAAFLGTYLGIRGLSFGSLRDHEGWREVAYRFRAEEPITVGKDVIKRMSGVLDEIEELGRNLRSRPSKATDKTDPVDVVAKAGAEVEPVTFVRREEPAPVPAPAPAAAAPPTPLPAAAPPPQPIARAAGNEMDRSTRYRRARALLQAGHDRETVRSMTGLKLAEVDLLRCAGAPGGPS
jgi:hypothetical protein